MPYRLPGERVRLSIFHSHACTIVPVYLLNGEFFFLNSSARMGPAAQLELPTEKHRYATQAPDVFGTSGAGVAYRLSRSVREAEGARPVNYQEAFFTPGI